MIPFFGGDEVERRMLDTVTIRDLGRLLELLAADAVRADFFQSVPEVGIAIGVVDGRREKVLRALHYSGNSSSVTTRVLPASDRRVTRSRKMSTATTCSMPSEVLSAFPSFGKRFRCCT